MRTLIEHEPSTTRRWAMLLISMTAAITTTASVNCVGFLIPELHRQGYSLEFAGLLAAAPAVGLLLTTIAWGALIDRIGERTVLLISLTGAVLAHIVTVGLLYSAAPLSVVAVTLFLASAFAASCNGASGRLVVGWFPPERRGLAMGIRQTSQPLAIALLSVTMPVLAHEVSLAAAMAVPLAISVVALVLVFVGIIDPPRLSPIRNVAGENVSDIENPYRGSTFLQRVHIVSMLLVLPQSVLWTFGLTWLIVGLGWAPAAAGFVVAGAQLLGAGGRIAAGVWSDRVGSRTGPVRYISIAAAIAMGAIAALTAVGSWWAVPVFVVASVITVADNGLSFTAVAERAGSHWSGRALGIQNTGQFIATSVSSPLLGAAISAIGFGWAFALVAVAPLLAIPLVPSDRQE